MKISVIGAGVTGLHAAYTLAKKGHQVTIYEKANFIGGLAHYQQFDGTNIEKFYHFIMTADVEYLDWLKEMGVHDQLHWVNTKTNFFANGKTYPFSTPKDILLFGAIPFLSRVRFAATVAYMTYLANDWKKLEKENAHAWLRRWCGDKAYDIIWESNLRMKFGSQLEGLRLPWVWARSRMVRQYRDVESGSSEEKRAWLKGSTKTMLDATTKKLAEKNVRVVLEADIEEIVRDTSNGGAVQGVKLRGEAMEPCDRVLYCAPTYALDSMLPGAEGDYFEMVREKKYFGVVCVVIGLKQQLTPEFWTYVNDPRVPFVGVINYSPFMEYPGHEGHHILYIPAYCMTNEAPYTQSDEEILTSYKAGLKTIWPKFDDSWVREAKVMRVPNASLVVTGEYSKRIPPIKSPIPGLFLGTLCQIYPQDRGISIGMKLSQYAVEAIENDTDVPMNFVPY